MTYEKLKAYIKPSQEKDWHELEQYLVSLGMLEEDACSMFDPLRASVAGHPCIDISKFGAWIACNPIMLERCFGKDRAQELQYLMDY